MNVLARRLATTAAAVVALAAAGSASASPNFPELLQSKLGLKSPPPCTICHTTSLGGSGTITRAFGQAMFARGLRAGDEASMDAAIAKMVADAVDSDGNGTTDIDQLKQGRDPNGASNVALNAPPVEYGCGGATIARGSGSSTGGLGGLAISGLVLGLAVVRRRRARRKALLAAAAASTLLVGCNPYEVSYVPGDVCSTGKQWTGGSSGSELMNPGRACIDCHQSSGGAPKFTFAGTVFPETNAKDLCLGVESVDVVITGKNGRSIRLVTNEAGNFMTDFVGIDFPYTAKIVAPDGRTNEMTAGANANTGDCNSCHTETGANAAPGRIFLP